MTRTTTAIRRLLTLCALACCAILGLGAAAALAAVPTVKNSVPNPVTDTAATLQGTVATDSALTDCYFAYEDPVAVKGDLSFTSPLVTKVNCDQALGSITADSAPHAVSATIPLPFAGAPIYYHLVATNASGTSVYTFPAPLFPPGSVWRGFGFGLPVFDAQVLTQGGAAETQAGARPFSAATNFTVTTTTADTGNLLTTDDIKNLAVKIPPGLVANPEAQGVAQCTEDQLAAGANAACPPESQIGTVSIKFPIEFGTFQQTFNRPVYNMVPTHGTPAVFGFNIAGNITHVTAGIRTGEDYGATVTLHNIPQSLNITTSTFKVWGVPADPNHFDRTGSTTAPLAPYLTLPTSCVGPVKTSFDVFSWAGREASGGVLSHQAGDPNNTVGTQNCASLDFNPTIQARPTTNVGDAPSGLDVDLHIPQNNNTCVPGPPVDCGQATAHLKDTTVTLPEGLTVNPSGANGLGACTEAQFGYTTTDLDGTVHTTPDPATCPDAAKLGSVEVDTPLLADPLKGAVYIAKPFDNPFNSLLALYITVDDPQTGIVVKLAGEVSADPDTGRLTASFDNNPQLPFEHFLLNFFGGAGGSLRTPATCGTHTTEATLNPWSSTDGAPAVDTTDPWTIDQACANSAGEEPNAPSLDAGVVSPVAASYTPGVITLRREDGSQQFKSVTLSPPPGMLGKLAGIPACSEAGIAQAQARTNAGDGATEQASPSCPAASQVGTVDVAAGAGPAPYNASGKVYMAGPYQGAPLSFVIVTPAVAGPFDLGVVVVRTALHIDPATAQITAVTDNIPSILDGIPLDVRTAAIKLDRDRFIRTGTSCDEQKFAGSLLSTLDQSVPLSQRFQLAECTGLAFKPKLALSLKGGTKRNGHPAFTSVLTATDGQANLGKVQVTLPPTMQLDQSHIQAPCTRPQFAAGQCPAASIIGTATATSPLVDYQLSGPVYLRTGNNPLPDIVLALKGPASQPIEIDTVGKIDTVNARLRTTIDTIPDAPVTSATISLQGAGKGLLVNNTDLCTHKNNADVQLQGQNNKTADSTPKVAVAGCKSRKGHKRHKHHKRHHRRHSAR
jgi:hypothetical protein